MSNSEAVTGFEIAGRRIGVGEPVYVVAEISANHHQNLSTALELIDAASSAGADAVKIQTYTADTITIESDRPEFRVSRSHPLREIRLMVSGQLRAACQDGAPGAPGADVAALLPLLGQLIRDEHPRGGARTYQTVISKKITVGNFMFRCC